MNPTRYRQVIETESCENLELEECTWISEDQKHSSQVAKMHYHKKRSREVALKGNHALKSSMARKDSKSNKVLSLSLRKTCLIVQLQTQTMMKYLRTTQSTLPVATRTFT